MSILRHLCRLIFLHIILISLFVIFALEAPVAEAADTSDKGRNITDDGSTTLVSAGRSFTLGFFTPPGAPPARRYVGIWFTVSPDTVYWVANRDRPLNGTSGALVMSDSGSLLLLDGSGSAVWSSGPTSSPPAAARLLDSGNLVVQGQQSNNGTVALWQSFDHPCDNMLPGMKIGKNLWSGGAEWYLSPWRSAADPAPGGFRYITEPGSGTPENVMWRGNGTKVYRTGPWNGKRFNGVPEMSSFADKFTFQLTVSPGEVTYGYVAKAGAPYSRVAVTGAGHVQRLVWDDKSRAWNNFFDAPRDDCDGYAKCGPFGLCDSDNRSTSVCGCVQGFSQVSQQEWSIRDYSRGCRRNVALDCTDQMSRTSNSTDGFAVLKGVKLPDTQGASVDMATSLNDCRVRCLANCSCVAYAAADLRAGGDGTGCIIWTNSFLDVRVMDDGQDFYLRLAISEIGGPAGRGSGDNKSTQVPLAAAVVPSVVEGTLIIVLGIAVILMWGRIKSTTNDVTQIVEVSSRHPGLIIPSMSYQIIKEATNDFRTRIGAGAFGEVYEADTVATYN